MPRTGGRAKGTPNKRSRLAPSVLEGCLERLRKAKLVPPSATHDPLENMLILALDLETPIEIRAALFRDMAKFCYPQRKAVELSGSVGGVVPLSTAESIAAIDAALEKRAKR